MSNFTRAMFNAYSNHKNVPNTVRNNYKNKIARGNYRAAFNAISKYLPYYKRNNLSNLVGQFTTHPYQPYAPLNKSKTNYRRNNNAKRIIEQAGSGNAKRIVDILQPYRGGSGGVQLGYLVNRFNKNPIKYAMVNRNTGNLYAFALLDNKNTLNYPQTRYLDILGGLKGTGGRLMSKIINNARTNNKNSITLKAVVQKVSKSRVGGRSVRIPVNTMGERNKLVNWYEKFGFTTNGKFVNSTGLQPMIKYLKNQSLIKAKKKMLKKRKANEIDSMLTRRVTRSRA